MKYIALLIFCLSVAFAGTVGTATAATPSNVSANEPAPGVGSEAIDLTRYTGIVRPRQMVVLAAPTDGMLYRVMVDEGDVVDADQPLAQMKQDHQQILVQVAEIRANSDAEVRAAKAILDESQIMLDRGIDLLARDAAHEWEVRRSRVQRDRAQADYDLAAQQRVENQDAWRLEQVRLEELTLRAPFSGRIVRALLDPGAFVERGTELLVLADLTGLDAEVHLPVAAYGKLEVGQSYTLNAAAPVHRSLQAELAYVEPIIDAPSQTFRCVFEIDNADQPLPAGFTFQLASLEHPSGDL